MFVVSPVCGFLLVVFCLCWFARFHNSGFAGVVNAGGDGELQFAVNVECASVKTDIKTGYYSTQTKQSFQANGGHSRTPEVDLRFQRHLTPLYVRLRSLIQRLFEVVEVDALCENVGISGAITGRVLSVGRVRAHLLERVLMCGAIEISPGVFFVWAFKRRDQCGLVGLLSAETLCRGGYWNAFAERAPSHW